MERAVREIMTTDVLTASPNMRLRDAAGVMKAWDIGSLPVCVDKKIVGIVTDRDITIRGVAEGLDPATARVAEVMSKDLVAVREDVELEEAENIMRDSQLRRLPVLNGQGDFVGYLSLAKVARAEDAESAGKVLQGVSRPNRRKIW